MFVTLSQETNLSIGQWIWEVVQEIAANLQVVQVNVQPQEKKALNKPNTVQIPSSLS